MALALPFMLFAMFPGWLNSLPKSGGWLNTVKVFLGFLELALAFKFLSNDAVAKSDNGGAGPTNSQIYTASYIVNVAGGQLAGTYTATLTYICTSTF